MTPDQFEYDDMIYGKPIPEPGSESSKKRHALYKSRMAELAQYRKILAKQSKKQAAMDSEKSQTSKHIEKYRHKEKHVNAEVPSKSEVSDLQASMEGLDPEIQKQINDVARAMVQKIYAEIIQEEKEAKKDGEEKGSSFTL